MTDLRFVPGIGAKKEKELVELGYDSIEKLKGADPDDIYMRLGEKQGILPDNACSTPSGARWPTRTTPLRIRITTAGGFSATQRTTKNPNNGGTL